MSDLWGEDPSPAKEDISERLILNLEGFEGPLDVLLDLARTQKVDLLQISILQLVEQYLLFIERARQLRLELAADYLVMASWLTYLKSRLLLPKEKVDDDELSAEEMAAILAVRLKKLNAMREAAEALYARARLGIDVFARGMPEKTRLSTTQNWQADYNALLKAYATQRQANAVGQVTFERPPLLTLSDAREWLERFLQIKVSWDTLDAFVKDHIDGEVAPRSVYASSFLAALELVREGKLDISQSEAFAPIMLRVKAPVRAK